MRRPSLPWRVVFGIQYHLLRFLRRLLRSPLQWALRTTLSLPTYLQRFCVRYRCWIGQRLWRKIPILFSCCFCCFALGGWKWKRVHLRPLLWKQGQGCYCVLRWTLLLGWSCIVMLVSSKLRFACKHTFPPWPHSLSRAPVGRCRIAW